MHKHKKLSANSYNLENCFGFNDDDIDLIDLNRSSIMNNTCVPLEFHPNKPYRLALYVRPNIQRRLNRTNMSFSALNATKNSYSNKIGNNVNARMVEKCESKKRKKKANDLENIMLFDENTKPENNCKKKMKTPEKTISEENSTITTVLSARKNVLKEVNMKPLTKTRQNKTRKSYERKVKEKETEVIVEPSSDEILKELQIKKLTRTKQKKTNKEDQEFENWANNMNSAFDDVDKFELSIAYD